MQEKGALLKTKIDDAISAFTSLEIRLVSRLSLRAFPLAWAQSEVEGVNVGREKKIQ
jgi:hypothetical protein